MGIQMMQGFTPEFSKATQFQRAMAGTYVKGQLMRLNNVDLVKIMQETRMNEHQIKHKTS